MISFFRENDVPSVGLYTIPSTDVTFSLMDCKRLENIMFVRSFYPLLVEVIERKRAEVDTNNIPFVDGIIFTGPQGNGKVRVIHYFRTKNLIQIAICINLELVFALSFLVFCS
jgi:hypothetical protein